MFELRGIGCWQVSHQVEFSPCCKPPLHEAQHPVRPPPGVSALDRPWNDADVVVLAGDIARPREAASWALGFDKPVLYVLGNHEFYGSSIDGAAAELKRLCAGTHVHVLDNDEVVIDGVRFLGSTLWTDFMLFGDGGERAAAIEEAQRLMRDFSRIRVDEQRVRCSRPGFGGAVRAPRGWLDRRLDAGACRTDGGDHPSRAVATEHSPEVRRFAAERVLRLGCRALARRRSRRSGGSTATRTTASTTS